jgi:hypothetical protein
MNVMSYDVYRTFAGNTCILTRMRTKSKFFPRYALYAWGVPLVVVGACLFIDLSHVMPSISIGQLNSLWFLVFVCLFVFVVCCCFLFAFYGPPMPLRKSLHIINVNKTYFSFYFYLYPYFLKITILSGYGGTWSQNDLFRNYSNWTQEDYPDPSPVVMTTSPLSDRSLPTTTSKHDDVIDSPAVADAEVSSLFVCLFDRYANRPPDLTSPIF